MTKIETRTTIRIPTQVHKHLRVMAALDETSINEFVVKLLQRESQKRGIEKLVASA